MVLDDKLVLDEIKNIIGDVAELIINRVDKMQITDAQRVAVVYTVIKMLNNGLIVATREDAYECFDRVLGKATSNIHGAASNLRTDLKGSPTPCKDIDKMMEESATALYRICKRGKGKEFLKFNEDATKRIVDEANRLGRYLTEDEIREVCKDVINSRR